MKIISLDRKSIKIKLATAFVITSIIPILLVNIIYYYNTSKLVQQNVESMTKANLEQTKVSLDVWMDSYEDILFQVYAEYRQVKKEMQEYLIAKQTVETILNIDRKKEQEKKTVR